MPAGRISTSIGRIIAAFTLTTVIASTAFLGDPALVKAAQSSDGWGGWLSVASGLAAPWRPYLDALAGAQAISYGNDGRLTVLLLGSDTRGGGIGRTDTIMVMSLKGNQISAASIPRDAARIPNPFGGGIFHSRVNSIARYIGLAKFEVVIEKLLNIEIDYYALVSFTGFDALVNVVDPISVNIAQPIKDYYYWDDPTSRGIYFPAASNYSLYSNSGAPLCSGRWKKYATPPSWTWCHHALVYVRSRKSGSDFQRARRQQNFVGAAIRAISSGEVGSLVSTANRQAGAGALMTDIPFNSSALALFDSVSSAYLANQVVFAPTKYAKRIPGTTAYQLILPAVRAWTAAYMK
jgi:anionic cell wall polymer biosynthesis LytR-Cps2A-Psr (LCP) family protein